ncbi:hypothetical protein [Nocardia sp. NPDC051833]|uniref:hypothetical protein n=1 Tax=Nocardia sp. NPDC051833 TaxID=3155674 RepID=UPI003417BA2C
MKKSLAVCTLAGALALAPAAAANAAAPAPVAPVAACYEWPVGAPGGCDFFQNVLQLLSAGSASLSGSK